MHHVYCISGLGADQRIFGKLQVNNASVHYINWIDPLPAEDISGYAARLRSQINHANPILLGVSFGGMMAIELAKLLPVQKVVLISSIKSFTEMPRWMKFCGKYRVDRILPKKPMREIRPLKALRPIQNYFLGAKSEEERRIANEFRDLVDPLYLRWSIKQVLNWQNNWLPPNIFHVHGDNDHIFPLKLIRPTHVVKDGGHFMVMSKYREVSDILNRILDENTAT